MECITCATMVPYEAYDNCPHCTKEKWAAVNHYHWLDKHLWPFLNALQVDTTTVGGIIGAHGDKCSSYRYIWDELAIPFPHGVAVYFLSYIHPWSHRSRETQLNGWIDPGKWVLENYYTEFWEHLHHGVDV